MDILYPNIFQALFETDIPRIVLRANLNLEVLKYNRAFKIVKSLGDLDISGKNFWDIYKYVDQDRGREILLREGLEKAINEDVIVKLPPFQYHPPDEYRSEQQVNWRQLEITPIPDNNQVVSYVLISANDITKEIINKQRISQTEEREQQLNEELAATNEELLVSNEELSAANEELTIAMSDLNQTQKQLEILNNNLEEKVKERLEALTESENNLLSLVMNAHYPLMILEGKECIVKIANEPGLQLLGKTWEEVRGKSIMGILPKIGGTPFIKSLKQVFATRKKYGEEEQIFHYQSSRGPAIKYISYYYDPLFDKENKISGVIVSANDITDKVKSRKALEKINEEQITLNNEIANINEELGATVEELTASNEELFKSQKDLERKNLELSESEERFRNLITQAPVGICVIKTCDLTIQEANKDFVTLIGKTRLELENRSIWEAVPETAEQYEPIMNQVIKTGVAYKAKEREVLLIRNGIGENVFVDFVFEPVINADGNVVSIMIVAIEMTDKVLARRKIEDVEERIRLAVEAAEMGTFDFNPKTGEILTSCRLNKIFGLEEISSRSDLLARIHPDDIRISEEAHQHALINGKMFYEARLIHEDNSIHWIRVQGNLYLNEEGQAIRLLGTVLDITEYKFLLQQKDDFISIASHELKTPITSLKASFQLLHRMKDNLSVSLAPGLIEQSSKGMDRIAELVEDLLDVGRISEGGLQLHKNIFTINNLLKDCCHHIRAVGRHELILDEQENVEVFADEHRIEQVVVNFVNNAVKYAPNSLNIYLVVEVIENFVKISVKDEGPGVVPEKLPYLFERYYRADSNGHKVSGLGLGLYISKEIINRHGGSIGVDSQIGNGSSFWFTLPILDTSRNFSAVTI